MSDIVENAWREYFKIRFGIVKEEPWYKCNPKLVVESRFDAKDIVKPLEENKK